MIKAVIFDLDGTILDSIDALWRAFNAGVTTFQLKPVAKKRLLGWMNQGTGLARILTEIYPELSDEAASSLVGDIIDEIIKQYRVRRDEATGLSDGAAALLARLKARGLKIGVVTSRTVAPPGIWSELDRLQLAGFVDEVVTAAESSRKPAPDGIIACLNRLEVLPEEGILVGDSQADIRAGKAAGIKTVAVATGVSDRAGLVAESPDFVFDNLPGFARKLDFILGEG